MKKILGAVTCMAFVAAIGTPAFADIEESAFASKGSKAINESFNTDVVLTETKTINNEDNSVELGLAVADSFNQKQVNNTDQSTDVDVAVSDSFNQKQINKSEQSTDVDVAVSDSFNQKQITNTDQSTDIDVAVSDSLNTDNSTDIDVAVSDSFNTETKTVNKTEVNQTTVNKTDNSTDIAVEVSDSFNTKTVNQDNDTYNANDNLVVEASLVQVSANLYSDAGSTYGNGSDLKVENEISLCNSAGNFSGISNVNLNAGSFNNAAAQVTIGIR